MCGIMSALSVSCMLFCGFIPITTYAVPAISGLLIIPAVLEAGKRSGFFIYLIVSIISILLVPDKELCFMFVCFFGFYPILKLILESFKNRKIVLAMKFLVFNICMISVYSILILFFKLEAIVAEFAQTSSWLIIFIILLGNIMFFVYDLAVEKIILLYTFKYKSRINRKNNYNL